MVRADKESPIAASNPLVPLVAPHIDTSADIAIQVSCNEVCYSGLLFGDAFPNSEAFVINSQKQPTTLVTFATTFDRNAGPFRLFGSNTRPLEALFRDLCDEVNRLRLGST
jgi:hypothetical protein